MRDEVEGPCSDRTPRGSVEGGEGSEMTNLDSAGAQDAELRERAMKQLLDAVTRGAVAAGCFDLAAHDPGPGVAGA